MLKKESETNYESDIGTDPSVLEQPGGGIYIKQQRITGVRASHFPVGTADQTGTEWTNLPACAGCGMWSGVLLCFACQTGI